MYFSIRDIGQMNAMVYNWDSDEVDVIVVTDGSRVLGLGDLGAQGMGIAIGKERARITFNNNREIGFICCRCRDTPPSCITYYFGRGN
jgi:hypothetical protein